MNKNDKLLRSGILLFLSVLAACGGGDDAGSKAAAAKFPPCRENLLEHVRQPSRLEVLNECTSISGTVREVSDNQQDRGYLLRVEPDPEYTGLLVPINNGLLAVEVTPVDRPALDEPIVGQHAWFYGALVVDQSRGRWVGLHPTWLIAALNVAVTTSDAVVVGDALSIEVAVTSVAEGVTAQTSEAELFLEVFDSQGRATRWENGRTNTSGTASFEFATLDTAGDYTLKVFASKDRQRGFGEAAFTVKRR